MTSSKSMQRWKKIKKQGLFRFIVVYGILLFGIVATIIAFFVDRVWIYGLDYSNYFTDGWGRTVFETYIKWSIIGIIWSLWMWFLYVKRLGK
ncbi:hypothetical protein [Paenibacillus sp. FSL W7-1287]|uniref:hypothetical protein n=1 Tax=Paenibacillus sp. FSL W7-1287 TaxID=2954538 RepID=UPI0030F731A3